MEVVSTSRPGRTNLWETKSRLSQSRHKQFTKKQLAAIKHIFDADPKLTALVFQDQSLFDAALKDIRGEGN